MASLATNLGNPMTNGQQAQNGRFSVGQEFSLARRPLLCKYGFMRTTVDLPDPLFRHVKSVAALRGTTLKEFIQDALQQAVASGRGVRRHKVKLPLIRSKHPGTLRLANADIENLLA
jgi:predicted DNA binding CopG/RHH family protein